MAFMKDVGSMAGGYGRLGMMNARAWGRGMGRTTSDLFSAHLSMPGANVMGAASRTGLGLARASLSTAAEHARRPLFLGGVAVGGGASIVHHRHRSSGSQGYYG